MSEHHQQQSSSAHRRRVPPPPPPGPPPPSSYGTPGGAGYRSAHSSSHSFSSVPSIISADQQQIEVAVTRSGDNSPVEGVVGVSTRNSTGLRRRGAKRPTAKSANEESISPPSQPKAIAVPAGTPLDESFTEVSRQKSNENLMAELESEMEKITGGPDRSSLGPAHPANRHYNNHNHNTSRGGNNNSSRNSPPTSSVVSKSNHSRGGDSARTHHTTHSPGHSLVLFRHNSHEDIVLPDYEEEVDFNSNPDSDAGLSLEDHVKMLQAELDAATIATAESGEMYDCHRRVEDRLEGTKYQHQQQSNQSDAVSVLSAGDPVDDFENNSNHHGDDDYYEHLNEGSGRRGGRSSSRRRAGGTRGSSMGSGHDGRRGGVDRRRAGRKANRSNSREFASSKWDGNASVALSLQEILIALVIVAIASFGGGYLFSSRIVNPSYLDDDTCTPSPHRIQESATYQRLLTKYESARKEISSLRISAMEDKENHYMETSLKTRELLKKAEEHTTIANQHVENMKTTMELQQKLTDVEQMYNEKIRKLEEQVKKREEEAISAAANPGNNGAAGEASSTGMEQLNPMADSVQARDAQWRKHDLQMASKIARDSHRAVLQKWGGGGPFRVEFVLRFPGEQGHAIGNRIVIETAPLGMMPHAVHMFLEMASGGLYTGTKFNFGGTDTVTVNIEHDDEGDKLKKKFSDYTPALSFPEYNDHFPHAEYTLGFMGRDPDGLPGPSFFINTKDNREKHGPQKGQFNENGFEIGAFTCFGKVVAGKHVVDRLTKRARYGMHGGKEGMLMKPVEIINTFVHMV